MTVTDEFRHTLRQSEEEKGDAVIYHHHCRQVDLLRRMFEYALQINVANDSNTL